MERTLIIKLIDGVWNSPHITSPLSGFLEPEIKQHIAFSRLVTPPSTTINMLTSFLQWWTSLSIPEVIPRTPLTPLQLLTWIQLPKFPKSPLLHQNHSQLNIWTLLIQMQRTDPFCKCISRRLLNGKAPHHGFDTFTHVKGLLYKHIMDTSWKFLALWSSPNLGNTQY